MPAVASLFFIRTRRRSSLQSGDWVNRRYNTRL